MNKETITIDNFPFDIWILILQDMEPKELSTLSLVSKKLDEISCDDRLWASLCERQFGSHIRQLKTDQQNWKLLYQKTQELPRDILNIANWSKDQIEILLENFEKSEIDLIKNLELTIMKQAAGLTIDSPMKLASLVFGHHGVNFHSYGSHIWLVKLGNGFIEIANNSTFTAAQTALCKAKSNIRCALIEGNWITIWNDSGNEAWNAAWNAVTNAVAKLPLNESAEIKKVSYRLGNLYVLAYKAQLNFAPKYFINSYNAALELMENDPEYKLSKIDIIKKIANATWLVPDLAQNPYINSLKRMIEAIAKEVR